MPTVVVRLVELLTAIGTHCLWAGHAPRVYRRTSTTGHEVLRAVYEAFVSPPPCYADSGFNEARRHAILGRLLWNECTACTMHRVCSETGNDLSQAPSSED